MDTAFFQPGTEAQERHFLIVSALVPYKRIDLAIDACAQAGVPLHIVGDGPERGRLEARAGGASFLGPMSGAQLRDEYRRTRAVLLPGEEDFGIVPVEAQACGTPVIALARGGALETVRDGETGILFEEPTPDSLAAALTQFDRVSFDRCRLRANAERFSRDRHVAAMTALIRETVEAPEGTQW